MAHYIVACVLEYRCTILIFYAPVAFAARDQCERRGFINEVRFTVLCAGKIEFRVSIRRNTIHQFKGLRFVKN